MEAIAENDLNSTFVIDNTFSWVIDGGTIEDPSIVDLTFKRVSDIDTSNLTGTNGTQFKINNTNADTKLSVSFKKEYSGQFANAYKQTTSGLEFVSCSKVNTSGMVLLPEITTRGEYAVMLQPYSDMPGDINGDGYVNAKDALAVLKHAVGIEAVRDPKMADVNYDGYINAKDALKILKVAIGLETM